MLIKMRDWLPRLKNKERPGCRGCVLTRLAAETVKNKMRPGCRGCTSIEVIDRLLRLNNRLQRDRERHS